MSTETTTDIVAAAAALAPRVRAAADDIEQARRLPAGLVAELARAGLFRMGVPSDMGGLETEPAAMIRAIDDVARADGSAGWCVAIGTTTSVLAAYLPREAAKLIYGSDPAVITGGVFAPSGRATVEAGGYRIGGRWAFASGCDHCTWLMGGCVIMEDGAPRKLPNGAPDARLMIFPADQATVIDTWTVSGLRGTGSHDIAVDDLYVPVDRAVSLIADKPRHEGALYAFPVFGLLALGIAGVSIGIARRAIDELVHLAKGKTPQGSRRLLRDRAIVQMQVAQAEASLRAARAFLFDTVENVWAVAREKGSITVDDRAMLRLAATHATISSAQVVDLMYNAGGGTSIYGTSPLQRCFRDVHVATQHIMVAPPTYEVCGRVMLGIETETSVL